MKLYLVLFILLIASVSFGAISVGVSPPIIELGTLTPGESKAVKFDFITSSEETLLVYMDAKKGSMDFFKNRPSYNHMLSNYSEEDTSSWVKLANNPIELKKPENSPSNIRGRREVRFLLEIPEDAEPGYHLLNIIPTPTIPSNDIGGAGAVMVSIVPVSVIFEVAGQASREGVILDTIYVGYDGNLLRLDTYFQNTGTDTMTVRAHHDLYDKNDVLIAGSNSQKALLEPGEVTALKSVMSAGYIEYNEYTVATAVDYITGTTYKNSTITVYPPPIAPMAVAEQFPITTVILIIAFLIIMIIIIRKVRE